MRSLIWFRRDLRLADNRALFEAASSSKQLAGLYFVTPDQWDLHDESPAKLAFWHQNLVCLHERLNRLNIPLLLVEVKGFAEIPEKLVEIAELSRAERVYFNHEYEFNERQRDEKTLLALKKAGVEALAFHDRLLIQPGRVLTGQDKPYTVYTPFRNNWAKQIFKNDIRVLTEPAPLQKWPIADEISELSKHLFEKRSWNPCSHASSEWCLPGEVTAHSRLRYFVGQLVEKYDHDRDYPAQDGTSRLSPYLAAGVLSSRQCLAEILVSQKNGQLPDFSSGSGSWLNEIIWRDFYSHVMVAFPRVSKGLPFQLITEKVKWRYDEKQLQAWQQGLTGYPIVDAAMRQLQQTGWMHNRLRMIAAMFLSKHLLLDWRLGERHFMKLLLDGDLAANNGGWQWSASTGTDAAPYFRVFNPFSQSQKFDAAGSFIRKFCPELEPISAKALHDPELLKTEVRFYKIDYPEPVVEHSAARARAIAAFKK
ncbi:MAG: deoxyribodipyrimidine photo-lyase [Candidatus Rifleibacteriota bacterium]